MAIAEARKVDAVRATGKVKRGKLTVPAKIALPDGNVEVTVVVTEARPREWKRGLSREELLKHPAFGMWKDRDDMRDSAAYVRKIRGRIDKELRGGRSAR